MCHSPPPPPPQHLYFFNKTLYINRFAENTTQTLKTNDLYTFTQFS